MIYLVNPPQPPGYRYTAYGILENRIPHLGIAYLAANAERHDFKVKIIDCHLEQIGFDELKNILISRAPEIDLLGFTATTLNIESAQLIATEIKAKFPRIPIIIGGPHVSALPEETMQNQSFDAGVIGEGEQTFIDLCRHMASGKSDLSQIPGIIRTTPQGLQRTPARELIENIDTLPMPARHLLPHPRKYHPLLISCYREPLATMFSSRGCPFSCRFCNSNVFPKKVRYFSPDYVVDEMLHLEKDYGVKSIYFHDDIFPLPSERIHRICTLMLKKGVKSRWACNIHPSLVNEELMQIMRKAGCWQVLMGLESGSAEVLSIMNKKATLEQGVQAVNIAKKNGLNVRVNFLVGTPADTKESLAVSLGHALKLKAHFTLFNIFVPYPGVPWFEQLKNENRIRHYSYKHYDSDLQLEDGNLPYLPESLTQKDIVLFAVSGYRKIYLNFGMLFLHLRGIRTFFDVLKYLKFAFVFARMQIMKFRTT